MSLRRESRTLLRASRHGDGTADIRRRRHTCIQYTYHSTFRYGGWSIVGVHLQGRGLPSAFCLSTVWGAAVTGSPSIGQDCRAPDDRFRNRLARMSIGVGVCCCCPCFPVWPITQTHSSLANIWSRKVVNNLPSHTTFYLWLLLRDLWKLHHQSLSRLSFWNFQVEISH